MKKQKICVLGNGLTGLTTALMLGKLGHRVDLISKKNNKKIIDHRVTAISPSNYKNLIHNLGDNCKKIFWPCDKIKLYYENLEKFVNFMSFENNEKKVMYIVENQKLNKSINKVIKRNKNINIIQADIKKISPEKTSLLIKKKEFFYDLIILCLGRKNNLISQLIKNRSISKNKGEIAVSTIVKHNSSIEQPRQYFFREGPFAILPINKKKFSVVWSLEKKYKHLEIKKINILIESKLKKILDTKNNFLIGNTISFPISFIFNIQTFKKNILIFGESSYNVEPIAGQGFNLILRDIKKLCSEVKKYYSLGLSIKNSSLLSSFERSQKTENLLFGIGINFTHSFFKYINRVPTLKKIVLKDLNKFKFLKKMSLDISDRGIFK